MLAVVGGDNVSGRADLMSAAGVLAALAGDVGVATVRRL
jgi:hypothetical protein